MVFYFSLGGVAVGALWLVWGGMHSHTARGIALLLAVGVLATIAQLLMTRAYSTGATLVNASLQDLGIAYAYGYGILLFDDRLHAPAMLGMALIVAAGLFATLLRSRNIANDPGRPPAES